MFLLQILKQDFFAMNKTFSTMIKLIGLLSFSALLCIAPAKADEPVNPVKWSQPPDLETGLDYNSMEEWYICADDFLCENPLPVNDVHWWGSYWAGDDPQPIKGFTVRFFADVPAGIDNFSHPGDMLYQTYIPGKCNETYYGYCNYDQTNVYQYDCVLPRPFDQKPGTVYWLSVQADAGWDAPPFWGWHTSTEHWNDFAVQAHEPAPWNWGALVERDMAFELTVVPEPSTLIMLAGLAVMSILAYGRKRLNR
ncbi:MAG: DUF7901 domain-containing protein [Thermoguttaceae bacterium]